MNVEDLRPLDEWGHDAMWLDTLHHELHVLLTGETTGYYKDFGTIDGLVRELRRERPERFVVVRAEPRPGRQPRVRRPPAARRAPRRARLRPLRARHSARVHGRGVRRGSGRSSSSPTTSTPRSPRRRARAAAREVERTSGARRRGARSAGRRDVRALEARAARAGAAVPRAARAAPDASAQLDVERRRQARDAHARRRRRSCSTSTRKTRGAATRDARGLAGQRRSRSGATFDGNGTNFALFSEHAERVELCLFDDDGHEERVELTERTALNWHGYLPGVRPRPALRVPRPRRPGRPSRARASTRRSSCSIRTQRRSRRDRGDAASTLPTSPNGDDADLHLDDDRRRGRDAQVRRRSTRASTGRTTTSCVRARRGTRP